MYQRGGGGADEPTKFKTLKQSCKYLFIEEFIYLYS